MIVDLRNTRMILNFLRINFWHFLRSFFVGLWVFGCVICHTSLETLRRDGFHHRGHTFFAPSPPLHSSQFFPSSSYYSPSHHTSCFFALAMSLIASVADQLLLLYAAKMQTTTLLPLTEELLFSWASLCFRFDRQLCRMKVSYQFCSLTSSLSSATKIFCLWSYVQVCLSLLSSLVSFISGVNETNASKLNQEPEVCFKLS